MKLILVDDEPLALEELRYVCAACPDAQIVGSFQNAMAALEYVKDNPVDFAFLDIQMPGMTGLELLHELHHLRPALQAAFVTAYDTYALNAYQADACGYLLKPFDRQSVEHILDKARRLIPQGQQAEVEIRTFDRFGVFVNGKAVDFKSKKAKELCALLVAKAGNMLEMDFILDTLWENEPAAENTKVKYRKTCMFLRESLKQAGIQSLLHTERGRMSLSREGVVCDYFALLDNQRAAALAFDGEFLTEYTWAEAMTPVLAKRAQQILAVH